MVEVDEKDEISYPLLTDPTSSSSHSHASLKRTGTVWTAIAHIITGVIGSGVLSLAWSMAQLGWIAGPICMVLFGIITIISSNLLCDCYRYPHPEVGHIRNRSYAEAVKSYLGEKSMWVAGIFVQESYFGYGIAYTITSAISMRAILKSNCYHKEGQDSPCEYGDRLFILLFGAVQVVFSQIPNFHDMEWLSIIAAVMSFAYTFIGFALGFAKVIENREIRGNFGGVSTPTATQKVWLSSQAIGDIAFAFTYNIILLDIQDTLKAPPPENKTMKKASTISILITSFFFLCCGSFGYAAFGNQAPGNLLTGFGFYEPYWLIDIANACIVLHLVGGYQIFSQPLFAVAERKIKKKHPNSGFVNNEYVIKLPLLPGFKLNVFRLCFRTAYVACTTGIAILFPYFNQVLGVLGALNFWPLAIYFPVQMYFAQNKVRAWTCIWIVLQAFRVFCLLCTILALIGSVSDCTQWLEPKSPGSVLYVSFGSCVHTSKQIIEEMAYGLLLSEVNFIWVVRDGILDSGDANVLPVGFEDEIKDKGLIVPWCNQITVLSNPAVGGFLTHNGWNSTVESMWCGVPMICYPVTYDQPTNRKLVINDWNIGVNLCDGESVNRTEVAEKIKSFMSGGGSISKSLRVEADKVKGAMQKALEIDGSSVRNFDQFLKDLEAKIHSKAANVEKLCYASTDQ